LRGGPLGPLLVDRFKQGGNNLVKTKKDTGYVRDVCGTTLQVTECGISTLDDIVCCEKKRDTRKIKSKKLAKK